MSTCKSISKYALAFIRVREREREKEGESKKLIVGLLKENDTVQLERKYIKTVGRGFESRRSILDGHFSD